MISNVVRIRPHSKRSTGFRESILDLQLLPLIGFCSLFFISTFNLVNVELTASKVTLDPQLMVKLAVVGLAGLYGAYGFLIDLRVRNTLLSMPGVLLFALCFVYLGAAFFGISKVVSIVSSGAILCAVLALTTFCVQHGREKTIRMLFYSLGLFVVGSWLLFILVPQYGVFREPLPGGVFLERMGGLSHPNTLGQYCAATIIFGACYWRTKIGNRKLIVAIVLLAVLALYFSLSRTSTAAAMGGVAIVFRDKIWTRQWITLGFTAAALGVFALLIGSAFYNMEDRISNVATSILSKSSESDSDELTTATGRSAIWAKTISLIQQRPLTGWGAGSSKELLSEYSLYTHNLILNIWLSSGIFGGISILLLLGAMLLKTLTAPSMVPDSLIVFLFLNGLFENVIFSNVASAPTLLFVLAVIWRSVPKTSPDELEVEYDSA
ncbi:O-antigen ligase family protein [bacterium]|nr:O-antigen ligase family protein [bacterium]